jgi:hypothetical protein
MNSRVVKVKPFMNAIQWSNEADLRPDTAYLDSVK